MAKGKKTGGRVAGVPNKATSQAREAIAAFVDGNAERLSGWLDEIYAKDGPKDAFDSFTSLLEYHVPKLARNENETKHSGSMTVEIVKFSESALTGE